MDDEPTNFALRCALELHERGRTWKEIADFVNMSEVALKHRVERHVESESRTARQQCADHLADLQRAHGAAEAVVGSRLAGRGG